MGKIVSCLLFHFFIPPAFTLYIQIIPFLIFFIFPLRSLWSFSYYISIHSLRFCISTLNFCFKNSFHTFLFAEMHNGMTTKPRIFLTPSSVLLISIALKSLKIEKVFDTVQMRSNFLLYVRTGTEAT